MENGVEQSILAAIRKDWALTVPEEISEGQLLAVLAEQVNHLILTDFQRLITILYRIDINETKLKKLLQENKGSDAANIIAWMILERQKEKKRSRDLFKKMDPSGTDEEIW